MSKGLKKTTEELRENIGKVEEILKTGGWTRNQREAFKLVIQAAKERSGWGENVKVICKITNSCKCGHHLMVITNKETCEKQANLSFLQKVREECKKYYNFDEHYTDCKKCRYERDCIFQSLDAESDQGLMDLIEKVLEAPEIAKG